MAGLFDSLIKEISSLAPQDDPNVKVFTIQNELKDIDTREAQLYQSLGKRVRENGGVSGYPDLEAQFKALDESRTEIRLRLDAATQEKRQSDLMASDEAGIECRTCGTTNPPGTKFCSACGTKLEVKAFCPACGTELELGTRFCGACGAKVGE